MNPLTRDFLLRITVEDALRHLWRHQEEALMRVIYASELLQWNDLLLNIGRQDAKAIIDIMVEVRELEDAVACIAPLRALGYAFIDRPDHVGRRFFRKAAPRTNHLHRVEQGSAPGVDHLAFCDAFRAHRELRQRYAQTEAELAASHRHDRNRYTESKTAFVESVLRS